MTKTTLVLGGTGKTGRRIVQRLTFAARAVENGVRRLVLLSGRGEEETHAGEQAIRESALGRRPRDFSEYARDAAATGIWNC